MEYTNSLNLPQPFVDAATREHKYVDGRYSVTALLKSQCEVLLQRRHGSEISGDVAQNVWQIFGSAVHKILEESKETSEQIKENYITVPIDEHYTLSGIFDLYDDSTGMVTDYKTCSCWRIKFGDFAEWRKQTLYYCWMLRQIGFDARKGQIVALIKDHSKRDAAKDPNYPQYPVFVITWDFTEEDLSQAEKEIREWFKDVAVAESLPDSQLVPCTPEQRWAKPEKWAVKKGKQKRALRVFDSEDAAMRYKLEHQYPTTESKKLWIEYRKGEDTKCEGYCDVRRWCPYYQAKVDEDF